MIARLRGTLAETGADWALIDVAGVGYLVHCSSKTLAALGEVGEACTVHTDLQVSENDMRLLGFAHGAERDWFRLLTGVQGVGGKVALAILGTLAPDEIARAITLDDKAMIARAPGVGPRLAARITTELKGQGPALGSAPQSLQPSAAPAASSATADAVSALENLGFRAAEAARAVAEAERDLGELPTPTLIREALKRASR